MQGRLTECQHKMKENDMQMTDRDWIKAAIDSDRDALIDGIKTLYNCRDADVDAAGYIWIADPQAGHWLDADGMARVARSLQAGDI